MNRRRSAATAGTARGRSTGGSDPARPAASVRRRLVGLTIVAVAVAVLAHQLYPRRHEITDAWRSVGWAGFALALGFGLLSVGLNAGAWRSVLTGLGVDIPGWESVRVFCLSQLGKYLPGSVWPVVAQVAAGRRHGAGKAAMIAANLLTVVVSLCVGLATACVLLPVADASLLRRYWWLLLAVPPLVAMLHPRAFSWVLDRLLGLLGRPSFGQPLPLQASLRSSVWSAGSWLAQGLQLYVLCAALGHTGPRALVLCIGSMAAAVCVGLLAIPVPAGAGVREAVLAITLTTVLASDQIAAVVLASRAVLLCADLLAAGLSLMRSPRNPQVAPAAADPGL